MCVQLKALTISKIHYILTQSTMDTASGVQYSVYYRQGSAISGFTIDGFGWIRES